MKAVKTCRVLQKLEPDRLSALTALRTAVFDGNTGHVKRTMRTDSIFSLLYGRGPSKPEVLVCGESNSGKSSLLKSVMKDVDAYARTPKADSIAGSTRNLEKYVINNALTLVDTPGYGSVDPYRWKGRTPGLTLAHKLEVMSQYIAASSSANLHRVYMLTPVLNDGLALPDRHLTAICEEYAVPLTIVVTKTDTATATQLYSTLDVIQRQHPTADLIPFSTKDPKSQITLQIDMLHTATKWLPITDLKLRTLQELSYKKDFISPEETEVIIKKHRRPLSQEEQSFIALKSMGHTPTHKQYQSFLRTKANAKRSDDLMKLEIERVKESWSLRHGKGITNLEKKRARKVLTSLANHNAPTQHFLQATTTNVCPPPSPSCSHSDMWHRCLLVPSISTFSLNTHYPPTVWSRCSLAV